MSDPPVVNLKVSEFLDTTNLSDKISVQLLFPDVKRSIRNLKCNLRATFHVKQPCKSKVLSQIGWVWVRLIKHTVLNCTNTLILLHWTFLDKRFIDVNFISVQPWFAHHNYMSLSIHNKDIINSILLWRTDKMPFSEHILKDKLAHWYRRCSLVWQPSCIQIPSNHWVVWPVTALLQLSLGFSLHTITLRYFIMCGNIQSYDTPSTDYYMLNYTICTSILVLNSKTL